MSGVRGMAVLCQIEQIKVDLVHKRVVLGVAMVLFGLLSVAVVIITDLHDRSYPEGLRASSAATLDFGSSGLTDDVAFQRMGELSDQLGIGLVKIAPDLAGNQSGQVFVVLGRQSLPQTIDRFGDEPDARVRDSTALANSYASGQYLVTGDTTRLAEFRAWLTDHRVAGEWSDDTLGATLTLVARQGSFAISLVAATAMMVALVLYWLSVKAKGRALRVLAGVPTWRIQVEDLGGFLLTLCAAALACDVVAVLFVGFTQGWAFVPYYATSLLTIDIVVVVATMVGAVAMSLASWPSAELLAAREPAVKSLRRTSIVLKATTFTLVLAAVAPALAAYGDAEEAAAQQAQWKSLADQVSISFLAALGESGFQQIEPDIGSVVSDAEARQGAALSYAWDREGLAGARIEPYDFLTLVNQKWLDLMLSGDAPGQRQQGLIPITVDQLPPGARQFLGANLELWSRRHLSADELLRGFSYYRSSEQVTVPVALGGNGDLVFPDDAVFIVAPTLHSTFNDSYLASVASTNNLVFTGLGPTQALLAEHGLQRKVSVKYVAEEGVLRAQVTAYFAWLQGVSLLALVVALLVSAVLGAFITAVLKARRDFPLLLAGKRWADVVSDRVASEWAVGLGLATLVVLSRGPDGGSVVAAVAVVALLASPLTHLAATRWAFARVAARKL